MAKGRKTGGRRKGSPKTGGRKKDTPNRLTALKRILGPMLARDAREDKLFDPLRAPEFDRLPREREKERWSEWGWDA